MTVKTLVSKYIRSPSNRLFKIRIILVDTFNVRSGKVCTDFVIRGCTQWRHFDRIYLHAKDLKTFDESFKKYKLAIYKKPIQV